MMIISKETFCIIIENFRQQLYLDKKHGEYIQEMFGAQSQCSYKNNLAIKSILLLLQLHFPKDTDGFCRIEHYCFFLEFGKFSDKDFVTGEELYDTLVLELQNKSN